MIDSDYLRRQAETCLLLSRSTFDLTVAGRLRELAAELRAKAAALDEHAHDTSGTAHQPQQRAGQPGRGPARTRRFIA